MRLLLVLTLLPALAVAADGPCRDDGDLVVCPRVDFDKLTGKCRGWRDDFKGCTAELDVATDYIAKLEAAAETCKQAPSCPVCPTCSNKPAKMQSGTRQTWGYALGIVGTAVAMAAPLFPQMGAGNQTLTVAGGLTLLSVGFVINLSFD